TELLYPWTLCNTPVVGRRPRLTPGQGLAGQACADDAPAFHAELPEGLYTAAEWGGRPRHDLRGVLTVPLRQANEPIGVAVLLRGGGVEPAPEEITFFGELGVQLSIAVGNARVYADAMREKVQNQLLLELGTRISGSLETGKLLEQILD